MCIRDSSSVGVLYGERLVREGVLTQEDVGNLRHAAVARLSAAFDAAQQKAEHYQVQELSAVPTAEARTSTTPMRQNSALRWERK